MFCADCGKPKLLDLFCGSGGAGMGYSQAGFCVTGVDLSPQKRYPFTFVQADAIEYLKENGHEYAAVHASPPCQHYSKLNVYTTHETVDLVGPTRDALVATGLPYIIENVVGAPLLNPLRLCGTQFGLSALCRDGEVRQLQRHRLFESNVPLVGRDDCTHVGIPIGVYGNGGGGMMLRNGRCYGYKSYVSEAREAMGMPWATQAGLSQAIPPAFSRWLGNQLLNFIENG